MTEGTMEQTAAEKRQRRPSVRLGEIGYQQRRGSSSKQHHYQREGSKGKSNETLAPLTLEEDTKSDGNNNNNNEIDKEGGLDLDRVAIGSWKSVRGGGAASKSNRGRGGSVGKRARSNNWASSKIDGKFLTSGGRDGSADGEGEGEEEFNLDDDVKGRNFETENSEEETEEERNGSPIHSFEKNYNVDLDRERGVGSGSGSGGGGGKGFLKFGSKCQRGTRGSDEMEGRSDSVDRNEVKAWLNQLGLGQYAPVFEIHEVDEEVLPMLTLEDLKDMGINVVGSRRKMYCSIQKLNRGFW